MVPIVLAMVLAPVAGEAKSQEILLAEKGQAHVVIVQPTGKLTSSEFIAVRDLTHYLGQIAGAEFHVVTDATESTQRAHIYIGRAAAKRLNLDPDQLEKGEWIVRTKGSDLYLTGGPWYGVEYAVNHFLEDVLGVHWWTLWDETVPSIAKLKIEPLDLHGKPAFPHSRRHDGKHLERYTFNAHNGATRDAFIDAEGTLGNDTPHGMGFSHNLPEIISWKEYGEEHPDWFARKEGKVYHASDGKRVGHCFTNPELTKVLTEKIRQRIQEKIAEASAGSVIYPVPFDYHLSQGDHGPSCQCSQCVKLTHAEGSGAAPLIQMLNHIATDIRKDYPWVVISTLAYQFTRKPSKSIRVADGVLVRVATETMNMAAPLEHPSNRRARQELLGWQKRAKTLGIWSYESDYAPHQGFGGYGPTWGLPVPNVHLLADRYRYWRNHGIVSVFQQTLGDDDIQTDMRPLKIWLSCKLMEDPDQDWRILLRTFTEGFYGPAGVHVRKYLILLHAAGQKHPSHVGFYVGMGRYRYLTLDFLIQANALFDEAQAEVADDPVLSRRVRRARIGVDRSIMLLWPKLVAEWVRRENTVENFTLNRDVVISRYEKTFREQLAKHELPKSEWPHKKYGSVWGHHRYNHKSRLRKVLAAVEGNKYIPTPVPKKFAGQKIYDYPVGGVQYKFDENEWTTIVDDSQAAGGRAIRVRGKGLELPVQVSNRTIKPVDVPGAGYHWYSLGRVNFDYGTGAFVFKPNTVHAYTFEYGFSEVWVSLKFDGPAFPYGEKQTENTAWLERMILVRPDKKTAITTNLSRPQLLTSGEGTFSSPDLRAITKKSRRMVGKTNSHDFNLTSF